MYLLQNAGTIEADFTGYSSHIHELPSLLFNELNIHIFIIKMLFYTGCSGMRWPELFFLYNHDFSPPFKIVFFDVLRNPFGLWSTCCLDIKVIQQSQFKPHITS